MVILTLVGIPLGLGSLVSEGDCPLERAGFFCFSILYWWDLATKDYLKLG